MIFSRWGWNRHFRHCRSSSVCFPSQRTVMGVFRERTYYMHVRRSMFGSGRVESGFCWVVWRDSWCCYWNCYNLNFTMMNTEFNLNPPLLVLRCRWLLFRWPTTIRISVENERWKLTLDLKDDFSWFLILVLKLL